MDKVEKQETLSKLYTLRAGLSLIAQERDNVNIDLKTRDEVFSKLESAVENAENELERERYESASKEQEYEQHIEQAIENLRAAQREYNFHSNRNANAETAGEIGEFIKETFLGWLIGLIGMAIGIAIMVALGVNEFNNEANGVGDFIGVGIFFAGAAILTIVSLAWIIWNIKKAKKPHSLKNDVMEGITSSRSVIDEEEKNIKNYQTKLSQQKEESAKKQEELQNNTATVKKGAKLVSTVMDAVVVEMLNTHKETAVCIYNSLSEEYSELLDERDWQYVDLFIYMYETGRADSKKEALQLIDQYQQNKNIVEAIERAGREIQGSICQGLGALQTSMERQFKALSGQLYQMHSETMLKMDRITNQLDNLNSEMSRLSMDMSQMSSGLEGMQQQLNLNTALQAKANVSSQQLMEDVKYMRTLDEQAEIRRRNGLNSYGQYS